VQHVVTRHFSTATRRAEQGSFADPNPAFDHAKSAALHHVPERRQLTVTLVQSHDETIDPMISGSPAHRAGDRGHGFFRYVSTAGTRRCHHRRTTIYVFPAWIALVSIVLLVRCPTHGFELTQSPTSP
jgi:hypothetical protein